MLSLPQSPFEILSDEHIAYQSCLNLETVGDSWGTTVVDETAIIFKFSPEIVARVLGFGLIHPPSTQGRAHLARDISACNDNSEFLAGLSYLYVMGVIRIFNQPWSADSLLSEPSINAKKLALTRDNYRCILTGALDVASVDNGLTTAGERMRCTALGHIFNESPTGNIVGLTDAAQEKLEWATSIAAVVQRFADISVVNVHSAQNTFTITPDFHGLFYRLRISLHPIGHDDSSTYEVHTYPPNRNGLYGLPDRVTLTDATGGRIPLPSSRYFKVHDACAKIAHFSGAGKVMEQIFQDVRDLKVLAEDGGSHLLSFAISLCLQGMTLAYS
ncbi:uncharacterized protein ARMOST_14780 [Armillaria ostoyae]|uniref:HNH nuclease domain-containing protein n=1 Tax=Armillaria ostoyae TaxID=47428 RepID=A0A284RRI3_ARMOS|nr:uncharacterized protein ARMOST_14780 [Armillaria ostoyae]